MSSDLQDFLYQEAKEKAFEIEIEARKEFQQKRAKLINEEKSKIQERMELEDSQKETTFKQSKLINQTRTNKLIARNKALIKLLNKTQIELLKKCKQDSQYYSQLLQKLIMEGLVKMMEPEVIIFCLQRDKVLIQELLQQCEQEYGDFTERVLGERKKVQLKIDDQSYMSERILPDLSQVSLEDISDDHEQSIKIRQEADDKMCFGGILLKDKTKQIICKNTLDLRTEMAFNQLLPEVRKLAFY